MEPYSFKEGDDVRVVSHYVTTGGVSILVEGFMARYVKEDVGKGGEKYITVYRTDQYASYRTIAAEHVVLPGVIPQQSFEIKGKKCIIHCSECGTQREILPSNLHNVKRCHECQKKYLKERARERRKSKRKGLKKDG